MAPRATIQNQKNSTLTLFKSAEILPKWRPIWEKINEEISNRFHIHSGVPQGSILGPLLHVVYTSDLPTSRETTVGTFADHTAIFATHKDPTIAPLNLQEHLHSIEKWLKKWKIKVSKSKSLHITFTLRKGHCPAININQTIITQTEAVNYLGLRFDCGLNWKEHIAKKRKQIDLKTVQLVDRKKIPSNYRRQITHLQSGNQTDMELRSRTVGLRQQVQHSRHAEIPIQDSQSHKQMPPGM